MTFTAADWTALAPGLVVALAGLLAVAVDLFLPRGGSKIPLVAIAYAGVGGSAALLYQHTMEGAAKVVGFGGLLVLDGLTTLVSYAVLAATALLLLPADVDTRRRHIAFGEYYGLILLACSAMILLVGSNDFLMVFLNLELLSLALYVLTGVTRRNPRANEAAMKYFVTGAFATGFLLLGISMVYGATGQLRFDLIGAALAKGPVSPLVGTGLAMVLVGFAFKIGAVPFHMWVPDVYEGAPTTTTAFMAVTVKAA
ncbi:MAG TPA: proton-conducting transporter membrane subunit, partial [Myxococcota bacterium]|nr:proton-conducting transporter membrane subunit [Myxococcota bacterium]